ARVLLERHGILIRGAVAAERVAGGFGAIYPVLRAMEDAGQCRRGYFVEGLGAAQFALPGAVDRMRAIAQEPPGEGPPPAVVLACTTPRWPRLWKRPGSGPRPAACACCGSRPGPRAASRPVLPSGPGRCGA